MLHLNRDCFCKYEQNPVLQTYCKHQHQHEKQVFIRVFYAHTLVTVPAQWKLLDLLFYSFASVYTHFTHRIFHFLLLCIADLLLVVAGLKRDADFMNAA